MAAKRELSAATKPEKNRPLKSQEIAKQTP
jgi:hypothetical protein